MTFICDGGVVTRAGKASRLLMRLSILIKPAPSGTHLSNSGHELLVARSCSHAPDEIWPDLMASLECVKFTHDLAAAALGHAVRYHTILQAAKQLHGHHMYIPDSNASESLLIRHSLDIMLHVSFIWFSMIDSSCSPT